MELLYLWIEDYRNIKNQGFNFSPEWEFTYENDLLSVKYQSKQNLPENYWKTNKTKNKDCKGISNVTAIVGENGAGKSSTLDFLLRHVFNDMGMRTSWYKHKKCRHILL